MIWKKLRKNPLKMNPKWFYIIVAYMCYTSVFWFALRRKSLNTTLPNLPPENRELFLISELHKIKNSFSLFIQRAPDFPIERTLCIYAYRRNYVYQKMDSQGNIAYLWQNKIIMILETFRFSSGKPIQNQDVATMLIPCRKASVEETML